LGWRNGSLKSRNGWSKEGREILLQTYMGWYNKREREKKKPTTQDKTNTNLPF